MNANGTNQIALTDNDYEDGLPHWSPDGSKIGFSSSRDDEYPGIPDVYMMNPDGGDLVRLTRGPDIKVMSAWSPDSSKIVFLNIREIPSGYEQHLYVMNSDGTEQRRLTGHDYDEGLVVSWSPDGSKVAFSSERDSGWQIYVMNADGTNETRITSIGLPGCLDGGYCAEAPSWSPDGSKIVFIEYDANFNGFISVINSDGTNHVRLIDNS
jgi:Tol biopolymer transport system component